MGPGQLANKPPTVSQSFSFARSPVGPGPRGGFWLGSPGANGAVSGSGGCAPVVSGAAPLGVKGGASWAPSVIDSLPSEHPLPFTSGQGLRLLLRIGPLTGRFAASPNGPEQLLPGNAAYIL